MMEMDLEKTNDDSAKDRDPDEIASSLAISLFAACAGSALIWLAVVKLPDLFLKESGSLFAPTTTWRLFDHPSRSGTPRDAITSLRIHHGMPPDIPNQAMMSCTTWPCTSVRR